MTREELSKNFTKQNLRNYVLENLDKISVRVQVKDSWASCWLSELSSEHHEEWINKWYDIHFILFTVED